MWSDYLLFFMSADHVRQAKDIENDSMVAQLLKVEAEVASVHDRESYEQNIKDCATTSFIGKKVNRMPSIRLLMLFFLYFDLQSWH